jgi:hypothetical protein
MNDTPKRGMGCQRVVGEGATRRSHRNKFPIRLSTDEEIKNAHAKR